MSSSSQNDELKKIRDELSALAAEIWRYVENTKLLIRLKVKLDLLSIATSEDDVEHAIYRFNGSLQRLSDRAKALRGRKQSEQRRLRIGSMNHDPAKMIEQIDRLCKHIIPSYIGQLRKKIDALANAENEQTKKRDDRTQEEAADPNEFNQIRKAIGTKGAISHEIALGLVLIQLLEFLRRTFFGKLRKR